MANKDIELSNEEIDTIIYSINSVKMDANKQLMKLIEQGANVEAQKRAIAKMETLIKKLETSKGEHLWQLNMI